MYALDDAVNGVHNPEQGAKNAQAFIADPAVLAVVGPFNSNVARAMMPILNQADLAQISPSNTNETLTKPDTARPPPIAPPARSPTSASAPPTTFRARRRRTTSTTS